MTGREPTPDGAASHAAETMSVIFGEASPAMVFSEPEVIGDQMVITACAWERAGGFGFGAGGGTGVDGDGGSGEGAGGGGASQGRPVAVISVGPEGVEIHPVIDYTKLGVTVFLAAIGVWRALRR